MPFARYLFTAVARAALLPPGVLPPRRDLPGRRRPALLRADRTDLWQVLFLSWMMIYGDATDEAYTQSLRRTGNRYAPARGAADRSATEGPRSRQSHAA